MTQQLVLKLLAFLIVVYPSSEWSRNRVEMFYIRDQKWKNCKSNFRTRYGDDLADISVHKVYQKGFAGEISME